MRIGILALAVMLTAVGATAFSGDAEARPSPVEGCEMGTTSGGGAYVACTEGPVCAWVVVFGDMYVMC